METKTFITTKLVIAAVITSFVVSFAFTPLQRAHAQSAYNGGAGYGSEASINTSKSSAYGNNQNSNSASSKSAGSSKVQSLQNRIKDLLELIEKLRNQKDNLKKDKKQDTKKEDVKTPKTCGYQFSRTIGRGSIGQDAKELQKALHEKGHYGNGEFTEFFGPLTEAAVQAFQKKEGIVFSGTPESTGYGLVGKKTRSALNRLCDEDKKDDDSQSFSAEPTSGDAPLKVTFFSYHTGQMGSAKIDFGDGNSEKLNACYAPTDFCRTPGENTHTYKKAGTYKATIKYSSHNAATNRESDEIKIVVKEDGEIDCDDAPATVGSKSRKWQKECVVSDGTWGLSDIQKVTEEYIDPIPGAVDDEYTEYTVVLKRDKGAVVIALAGFRNRSIDQKLFIEKGFTGDADDFFKFISETTEVKEKVDLTITSDKLDKIKNTISATRRVSVQWQTQGVKDCELTREYAGKTITKPVSHTLGVKSAQIHRIKIAPLYGLDEVTLTCISNATGDEVSDSIKVSFPNTKKQFKAFVDGQRVKSQNLTREKALGKCLEIASDNRYDKVRCTFGDNVILKKNNPEVPTDEVEGAETESYASEAAYEADTNDDVDEGRAHEAGYVQGASTTDVVEQLEQIVSGLQKLELQFGS